MNFWDWLSSRNGELALAGIAGSAVSVAMEWTGVLPAIRKLFVGAVTAYYLGPIGVPMFRWALGAIDIGEQAASVGGFIIGVGGVIIVEIILKAFRIRSRQLKEQPHE